MTRNYYLLLGGYFISSVGNWLYQLALPLLVYEITDSPFSMAVTYGLAYLPYVFFLPVGGVIADRVDRRRLLVFGDVISALVVTVLTVGVWQGIHSMWFIYPFAFLLAGVTPFYHPAFQSFVPSIVADNRLAQGNAWLQSAEDIVTLVGPLLGGIFIATLGTRSALALDAFSFVASALLIATIHIRSTPAVPRTERTRDWLGDLREGFQYVWAYPIIRYGSLLFFGTNFAITLFQANFIYFLAKLLNFTPSQIGLTFAASGLGAIGGALITSKIGKRFPPGRVILTCTVIAGLMTLPLLVAHDIFSIAVLWAVVSALGTINAVTWFTLRQRVVPRQLLGRVVALTRLIAFLSIPIAAVVGGILLNNTQHIYLIIALTGIIRITVGLVGFLTPLYRQKPTHQFSTATNSTEVAVVD